MKNDMAARWGVPVEKIEALWNTDKLKQLEDARVRAKPMTPERYAQMKAEQQKARDEDELRSIMEEYECEEWRAKQIQAKRKARQEGVGAVVRTER